MPSARWPKKPRNYLAYVITLTGAVLMSLTIASCADGPASPRLTPSGRAEIQDAAHNGGAAHFFFAYPVTKDPLPTGAFNPAARPVVQICEWTGTDCSTVVAEFDVAKGTGAATVKIDAAAERYFVNWNTGQCKTGACVLDPAKTYRVRVLVGGLEAGHADIDVVTSQAQAKNVNTNEYIPLVDGKLLQIRFRIEDGLSLKTPVTETDGFYPNSTKYRDAGAHPATGRDGSATLAARALLSKDGTTQLELTTGALDASAPAPGNIDHVQFKLLASDNSVMLTKNYTGLSGGGAWSEVYSALAAHQGFQVQTNISGIDADRTDVVTVQGAVQRRPDLAAVSLDAPQTVAPDAAVSLVATVREKNGDVGATGNCVLYVDGSEVGRADGIWVDAGDAVDCKFSTAFKGSGQKTVTVSVEGVKPGDDDLTNNSVSATVTVSQPVQFTYYSNVYSYDYTNYKQVYDQTVTSDDKTYNDSYHYETTYNGKEQNAYAYAVLNTAISFPLSYMKTTHTGSGNVVGSASFANQQPVTQTYSYEDAQLGHVSVSQTSSVGSAYGTYGATFVEVFAVSRSWTGATQAAGADQSTELYTARSANQVTYFGKSNETYSDTRRGISNTWVNNYSYTNNDKLADYTDYTIDLAVAGADPAAQSYAFRAYVPSFYSYTYTGNGTTQCYDYNSPDELYSRVLNFHYCYAYTGSYLFTGGSVSGVVSAP